MEHSSLLTQRAIDPLLVEARDELRERGSVWPLLVLNLADKGAERIGLVLAASPEERYVGFRRMGRDLQRTEGPITEALLVMEGWYVEAKHIDSLEVQPSQHPQRREAIMLVGRNASNSRHCHVIQTIRRDEAEQPHFLKPVVAVYDKPATSGAKAVGLLDAFFAGVATVQSLRT